MAESNAAYLARQVASVPDLHAPYNAPVSRADYEAIAPYHRAYLPWRWSGDLIARFEDPAWALADLQKPQAPDAIVGVMYASFVMQMKACGFHDAPWPDVCPVSPMAAMHERIAEMLEEQAEIRATYGAVLDAIATAVGFIPVVGQGIAIVLSSVASLATGRPISRAAIDLVVNAVPGGAGAKKAVVPAIALASSLAQGEPLEESFVAAGREAARELGGDPAAQAFEIVYALARGKDWQDVGFSAVNRWFPGTGLAHRLVRFGAKLSVAAAQGQSVERLVIRETRAELGGVVGREVDRAVAELFARPESYWGSVQAFANGLRIPLAVAQAAFLSVEETPDGEGIRYSGRMRSALIDPSAPIQGEAASLDRVRAWAARAPVYSEIAIQGTAGDTFAFIDKYARIVGAPPPVPSSAPTAPPPLERAAESGSRGGGDHVVAGIVGAGALAALGIVLLTGKR